MGDATSGAAGPATDVPAPQETATGEHLRRSRYGWAVLIAVLGVVLGAAIGWHTQERLYRSEGLVYVNTSMPSPLDPPGLDVPPRYRDLVACQMQILQSRRTTLVAMETDDWTKTGESLGSASAAGFEARRRITHTPGTQLVRISFTDSDPDVAVAGVHALLEAYAIVTAELIGTSERLEHTRKQVEMLTGRTKVTADEILMRTADFVGVEGLELRHTAAVQQSLSTEEDLEEVRAAIKAWKTVGSEPRDSETEPPEFTAGASSQREKLLGDHAFLEAVEAALAKHLGDEDELLMETRRRLRGRPRLEELKARETALTARLDSLRTTSRELGKTRVDVERLQAANDDLSKHLGQMKTLEEQLRSQHTGMDGIAIADRGSRPATPCEDRRLAYAGIGAGLGALPGLFALLEIAVLGRRSRNAKRGQVEFRASR